MSKCVFVFVFVFACVYVHFLIVICLFARWVAWSVWTLSSLGCLLWSLRLNGVTLSVAAMRKRQEEEESKTDGSARLLARDLSFTNLSYRVH